MFVMWMMVAMAFLLTSIMMLLALGLSMKMSLNREKATPFECGFDSNSTSRLPFSLRYFLITIVFLIFDVEVVVLLPSLKALTVSLGVEWWLIFSFFLGVLILGLFHEWNQGALKWSF